MQTSPNTCATSERYFLKKSFPSFYISLCTKLQKTRHTFYPFPVIIITCYRDKSITGGRDILKDFTSVASFCPPDRNICCVSDLQCLRLEGHGKKLFFLTTVEHLHFFFFHLKLQVPFSKINSKQDVTKQKRMLKSHVWFVR